VEILVNSFTYWVILHIPRKRLLRDDKNLIEVIFITDVVFDEHLENEIIELFPK